MKVGIAVSSDASSTLIGQHLAHKAIASAKIKKADIVLAFCSKEVDHFQFFATIQETVGDATPIIGGSAAGIISNNSAVNEGPTAGVMLLESSKIKIQIAAADNIDSDEESAGKTLAQQLQPKNSSRLMLLLYDSIKIPAGDKNPPILNASPLLLRGINHFVPATLPLIGAGLLGDYHFSETYQFCGNRISQQSAVAALFSGNFKVFSRIMHGCTPQDGLYHTITKSEGCYIYEIDNRPIIDCIDEMYGTQNWHHQLPVKRLTIGVNHGERFQDFDENSFVNRLISGVLPDRRGIVVFEPDLTEGSEFMFMLRDTHEMMHSVRDNTTRLIDQVRESGSRALFALYIDCAGRAARFSETLTEEAVEVTSILNRHEIPLFGFYSGVEIAPFLGTSKSLDWTGILIIFAE